jgi:putative transposase
MPRIARIVIPDVPYHVTQRGNNRQDVFFSDDDRRVYLECLALYARRFGLDILGWCLMTNHVHVVAVPSRKDSLALVMGRTDLVYTQHVNRTHERSGHLWQNRFYSCALDEKGAVAALRYVEQNPVRAHVSRVSWTYEWSSAAAHLGAGDRWGLLDLAAWRREWTEADWQCMLKQGLDDSQVNALRRNTMRGRPLGSDAFVSRIEALLGRRAHALPVGRPRGWRKHGGAGAISK